MGDLLRSHVATASMILPGACPVSQLEIASRLHGVDAELDSTPKASAPPSPRKPRAQWLKSSLLLGVTGMDQGCGEVKRPTYEAVKATITPESASARRDSSVKS